MKEEPANAAPTVVGPNPSWQMLPAELDQLLEEANDHLALQMLLICLLYTSDAADE